MPWSWPGSRAHHLASYPSLKLPAVQRTHRGTYPTAKLFSPSHLPPSSFRSILCSSSFSSSFYYYQPSCFRPAFKDEDCHITNLTFFFRPLAYHHLSLARSILCYPSVSPELVSRNPRFRTRGRSTRPRLASLFPSPPKIHLIVRCTLSHRSEQ